jgi:hypothetical protein
VDTVQSMISVTVSVAALTSYGVAAGELDRPELSPEAVHLLRPLLQSQGFDVAHPISIEPLSEPRGIRLTQVFVYPCPPTLGRLRHQVSRG